MTKIIFHYTFMDNKLNGPSEIFYANGKIKGKVTFKDVKEID